MYILTIYMVWMFLLIFNWDVQKLGVPLYESQPLVFRQGNFPLTLASFLTMPLVKLGRFWESEQHGTAWKIWKLALSHFSWSLWIGGLYDGKTEINDWVCSYPRYPSMIQYVYLHIYIYIYTYVYICTCIYHHRFPLPHLKASFTNRTDASLPVGPLSYTLCFQYKLSEGSISNIEMRCYHHL